MLKFLETPKNLKKQQPTEDKRDAYKGITTWDLAPSGQLIHTYRHKKDDNIFQRLNYGSNDFPQQVIQDIRDSPVASSCIDVISEYIYGNGFVSTQTNDFQVNLNQTGRKLLEKISRDVALLEGFALHVSYNLEGEITEIHHVPFEQVRLGIIEKGVVQDIKVNPYFGIDQAYERKYTKTYYTFNPKKVKEEIEQHNQLRREGKVKNPYPGQIFWVAIERPLARIYPIPAYYSCMDWVQLDAEIQKFHRNDIKNNFYSSVIINVEGDPDQPAGEKDSNGDYTSTVAEEMRKEFRLYASGARNAGEPIFNFYRTASEKATIEAFPTNGNDTRFQQLQDQTNQQICIGMQVPPILIGVQTQGTLGENQQIINAIRKMQAAVKTRQHFIAESLKELFSHQFSQGRTAQDFEIKDVNKINVLPEWAFDVMSDAEKRAYLENNFDVELIKKEV